MWILLWITTIIFMTPGLGLAHEDSTRRGEPQLSLEARTTVSSVSIPTISLRQKVEIDNDFHPSHKIQMKSNLCQDLAEPTCGPHVPATIPWNNSPRRLGDDLNIISEKYASISRKQPSIVNTPFVKPELNHFTLVNHDPKPYRIPEFKTGEWEETLIHPYFTQYPKFIDKLKPIQGSFLDDFFSEVTKSFDRRSGNFSE